MPAALVVGVAETVATWIGARLGAAGVVAAGEAGGRVWIVATGWRRFDVLQASRVNIIMNRSHECMTLLIALVGATADSPSWIVVGVKGQQDAANAHAIFSHPDVKDIRS